MSFLQFLLKKLPPKTSVDTQIVYVLLHHNSGIFILKRPGIFSRDTKLASLVRLKPEVSNKCKMHSSSSLFWKKEFSNSFIYYFTFFLN